MKTLLIILCALTSTAAQTPNNLHLKYGRPANESYLIRLGILVTVTPGSDGNVCEMLIHPQLPATPIKSSEATLRSDTLNEIIDELIPKAVRGKRLGSEFLNLMCLPKNDCAGTGETYEKVYIYRNGGIDAHRYATIQWKRDSCGR